MTIYAFSTQEEMEAISDADYAHHPGAEYPWIARTGADRLVMPPVRVIPAWKFRDRLTQEEQLNMHSASQNGEPGATLALMAVFTADEGINLDSATVVGGIDYWVSIGVLAPERKAEVLA